MHKRLNSHFEAEGGSSVEEDVSMQCKSANPIRLDHRMHIGATTSNYCSVYIVIFQWRKDKCPML